MIKFNELLNIFSVQKKIYTNHEKINKVKMVFHVILLIINY